MIVAQHLTVCACPDLVLLRYTRPALAPHRSEALKSKRWFLSGD